MHTPERLTSLGDELWAVVERYAAEPSTGEDAQQVTIVLDAVPHRSGETAPGPGP